MTPVARSLWASRASVHDAPARVHDTPLTFRAPLPPPVTLVQLNETLHSKPSRRLHFCGHADVEWGSGGAKRFTLGFTTSASRIAPVEPRLIAQYLGRHAVSRGGALELVFINGCRSLDLGRAVRDAGVPYVVCWASACDSLAATYFAATFYRAFAQTSEYELAFADACNFSTSVTVSATDERHRSWAQIPKYELRPPNTPSAADFEPKPIAAGVPALLLADGRELGPGASGTTAPLEAGCSAQPARDSH